MWLEVLLAVVDNVRELSEGISMCLVIMIVLLLIFSPALSNEFDWSWNAFKSTMYKLVFGATFFGFLATLPTVDDLWKVRIGLIKRHLASPENIDKGAEVIERLGKKLECKYLGCEEEKK